MHAHVPAYATRCLDDHVSMVQQNSGARIVCSRDGDATGGFGRVDALQPAFMNPPPCRTPPAQQWYRVAQQVFPVL
jgi:hypothetical protein